MYLLCTSHHLLIFQCRKSAFFFYVLYGSCFFGIFMPEKKFWQYLHTLARYDDKEGHINESLSLWNIHPPYMLLRLSYMPVKRNIPIIPNLQVGSWSMRIGKRPDTKIFKSYWRDSFDMTLHSDRNACYWILIQSLGLPSLQLLITSS